MTAVVALVDKAVVQDIASGRMLTSVGADRGIDDMFGTAISADGIMLLTVEKYVGARLWNAQTNRARCSVSGVQRPIRGTLSPDVRFAVIATGDNLLIVTDRECNVLAQHEGNGFPGNGFAIAENGRVIASVSDDSRLILWQHQALPDPSQ